MRSTFGDSLRGPKLSSSEVLPTKRGGKSGGQIDGESPKKGRREGTDGPMKNFLFFFF
ncbi:hypothetical protein Hanom_Chr14g01247291 [Helianthus anomalus]